MNLINYYDNYLTQLNRFIWTDLEFLTINEQRGISSEITRIEKYLTKLKRCR